jgi:hypothetical protein
MVRAARRTDDVRVPRLLVLWSRPSHLTDEEADGWARSEVRALLAGDAVTKAELTRLESASPRHRGDWGWLLALELAVPAAEFVEHGRCAELLGDLRLLGMRPAVMLAAGAVDLNREDG